MSLYLILGLSMGVSAASFTTVYVVDSISTEYDSISYDYNSNGFVSSIKLGIDDSIGLGTESTFKYNKSGNLKSVIHTEYGGFVGTQTYIYNYKYKNNKLNKIISSYQILNSEPEMQSLGVKFYKDGRIKSIGDTKFNYNSSNQILPCWGNDKVYYNEQGDLYSEGISLVYDSNRLIEKIYENTSIKLHYKQVKIKKNFVTKVKNQQWCVINNIFDNAYYYQY